jgi:hypothetical protein
MIWFGKQKILENQKFFHKYYVLSIVLSVLKIVLKILWLTINFRKKTKSLKSTFYIFVQNGNLNFKSMSFVFVIVGLLSFLFGTGYTWYGNLANSIVLYKNLTLRKFRSFEKFLSEFLKSKLIFFWININIKFQVIF